MNWETQTEEKFKQLLEKIPVFLRDIAKEKVSKTAEGLAEKENRSEMTEKDLVDAFFVETPFGFHGPMKTDMEAIGIDYTQYGHER
ncbi:MAG: DUF2621 family protein [Candidatus Omnitrophica bacterium]|nr:DUF2621 family protein [Candidatus Omnitrophota bacterium]